MAETLEPADGSWHWVLYECWGGDAKWVPAQRQRNHWNSAEFRGIPLYQVKVGPELTYAAPAIEPIVRQPPEEELRRLIAEEEIAHRERMAPLYKALAGYVALRPTPPIGYQWAPEEIADIQARGVQPLVINMIPKVDK